MKPGITQAQRERYLIAQGVLSDPSMPDAPAPVQEVIDNLQAEQQQQQQIAVDLLRQQLDELQGRLNSQPLSIEELVAARQEIADYLLKAADANAQLVVISGTGSRIRADLEAIATPLHDLGVCCG